MRERVQTGAVPGAEAADTAAPDRRGFPRVLLRGRASGARSSPGVLWARLQEGGPVTSEMLAEAEKVAGLAFTGRRA